MITINLLPVSTLKQQSKGKLFLGMYAVFLVIGLGALFSVKANVFDEAIKSLTAEQNQVDNQVKGAQKQVKEATAVTNSTVLRWKQLAAIMELEERRRDQTRLLVELEDLLPKTNAWLLSLRHNSGLLSLEGISTDKETVSQFLTRLENATYIDKSSVQLVQISQDLIINGVKLTKFSINARTTFPQPVILGQGLPEFGLPSQADFIKAVTAVDEKLVADLTGAAGAKKGL
ncbi:MAG: PilN domain-containing protein [Candidatus Adiutrix sp.]|jgi:Tfp pilus assembly protein PilN|nr:PilN domain-containing protein [Candidatus Adiutrix sp.]